MLGRHHRGTIMTTITIIRSSDASSGSFEAAGFFKAHKRATSVRIISSAGTYDWHYKGPRKDVQAIYASMTLASPE